MVKNTTAISCPCGSGEKYPDCCGQTSAIEKKPRGNAEQELALFEEAIEAHQTGRVLHSLSVLKVLLERQPCHLGALRVLPVARDILKVFDREELARITDDMCKAFADDDDIMCNAGDVYQWLGEPEKAQEAYRHVLSVYPNHFRAHFGSGNLANRANLLSLAEYHYRLACYVQSFAPRALTSLGHVLGALGRKHEAEHYLRIALAQQPGDASALLTWSQMEESRGNTEKAWDLYNFARQENPELGELGIHQALLHRRTGNFKQAIVALDKVDVDELDDDGKVNYLFERHRALDKLKLYSQSFDCASLANEIKRERLGYAYDYEKQNESFRKLKSAFTKKSLSRVPRSERLENEEQPIFICGFTRSGTSMVEQILSSHSEIVGGDELPFINDITTNVGEILGTDVPYPDCLFNGKPAENREKIKLLKQRYLNRLRLTSVLEPGVRRFTDKMPMNEKHLGLIHCMFPDARVLHVFRHPLDSVLSSFFTDASHGGFCSYDLKSAATHYMSLFNITQHYLGKAEIDYKMVRYEDIVDNINREVRAILKFIDVPFEVACLEFHKNPRYALTASYAQVTEKLYRSSRYRYRHYRSRLDEIIPILLPAIRKLGYDVD